MKFEAIHGTNVCTVTSKLPLITPLCEQFFTVGAALPESGQRAADHSTEQLLKNRWSE